MCIGIENMGINEFLICKNKTLILTQTDPDTDMMFKAWGLDGYHADIIFKPQSKFVRGIRRIWTDLFVPGFSMWLGNWKYSIFKYDTVILHASERTRRLPKYIHNIKPSMRIIYWYWNPVNEKSLPQLTHDKNIECWSFDVEDCKKYSMKYNVQYYYSVDHYGAHKNEYDIYFIGHDKGRCEILNALKQNIEKLGIKIRLDIVRNNEKNIPYKEVQRRISKANAILEINQAGQIGITLRAMEALFFRKKLVTNNEHIVQEDFYNPNNIFIIGKDDMSHLEDFLSQPYDTVADSFRNKHTIDAWFSNFFIYKGD